MERSPPDKHAWQISTLDPHHARLLTEQSSGASSTLTERISSWKDSASNVVESIRKRLGSLRRTKSTSCDDAEVRVNATGSSSLELLDGEIFELKGRSQKDARSTQPVPEIIVDEVFVPVPDSPTSLAHSSSGSSLNRAELGSAEETERKRSHVPSNEDDVSLGRLSLDGETCDQLNTDLESQSSGPPFCSACIGTKSSAEQTATLPSLHPSDTANCSQMTVKKSLLVVNQQPIRSYSSPAMLDSNWCRNSCASSSRRSRAEDKNELLLKKNPMSNSKDETTSLLNAVDLVTDRNGSAAPITCDVTSKRTSVRCVAGNCCDEDRTKEINLWDLRNSLENSKLKLKCGPFSSHEGCINADTRDSTAADVTESPRSTSSSERVTSREKWTSDSEDECSRELVASAERNGIYEETSNLVAFSKKHNYDVLTERPNIAIIPNDSDKSIACPSKRNVIITQAVIERTPDDDAREKNRSNYLQARHRRKRFEAKEQRSHWDSCDSDVFLPGPGDRAELTVAHESPKKMDNEVTTPIRIFRQSAEERRADRKKLENRKLYSIIRFVNDEIECIDACDSNENNEKDSQHNVAKTTDADGMSLASTSSSAASSQPFIDKDTYGEKCSRRASMSSRAASFDSYISSGSSSRSLSSCDTVPLPPAHHYQKASRCKYQTKPESSASSAATSPSSPTCRWPRHQRALSCGNASEAESSSSSSRSSSRSASSLRGLSRLFRRTSSHKHQKTPSEPTFCGYTMGRDFSVDAATDKIFKEFLCPSESALPAAVVPNTKEPLPPPSHMLPPRSKGRSTVTQLRRQVMRKQYSDSIAIYYGQQSRRLTFIKQKSDTLDCPVNHGVLRRQDRIEEEFDPEEINERLSSTSSRRDSMHPPLPTVNELKEWRRSSEEHPSVSRCSSLSGEAERRKSVTQASAKRVTFESRRATDIGSGTSAE